MKQAGRPFPLNTDVGVLKWRLQGADSQDLPLIRELLLNTGFTGSTT